MGLPMFREPDEVAAEQAAAKLDQIAATRRSTIRRESTVRPHRQSPPDRDSTVRRNAREQSIHRFRDLVARREREEDLRSSNFVGDPTADLETQIEYLRRERLGGLRTRGYPDSDFSERSHRTRGYNDDNTIPDGQMDLDMEILYSDAHDNIPQNLPRPSRESGLRFEVAASSQSESEQPRRRRFYHSRAAGRWEPTHRSPPRSRSPFMLAVQRPTVRDSAQEASAEGASLTPGFAPAHGPFRTSSQPVDDRFSRSPNPNALPSMPVSPSPDTPLPERIEASYPPLRRVNHLSPRPPGSSGPRVDGLGDRLRSPSPASEPQDEENWARLITSMQPGRSSNATSFMSSRSDSRSDSNRSSQAATTATSFGEIGGDDSCDLDLPFGITEEDVREIRARNGRLRPRESLPLATERIRDMERNLERGEQHLRDLQFVANMLRSDPDVLSRQRRELTDDMLAALGVPRDVVRGSA